MDGLRIVDRVWTGSGSVIVVVAGPDGRTVRVRARHGKCGTILTDSAVLAEAADRLAREDPCPPPSPPGPRRSTGSIA